MPMEFNEICRFWRNTQCHNIVSASKHSLHSASAVLYKQSQKQYAANLNAVDPTATAVFHKLEEMSDCMINNTFQN